MNKEIQKTFFLRNVYLNKTQRFYKGINIGYPKKNGHIVKPKSRI